MSGHLQVQWMEAADISMCRTLNMSSDTRTIQEVRDMILSSKMSNPEETMNFYHNWAEYYEQDQHLLDYRAPCLATDIVSTYFTGDRETAMVLDVACGTGLVAAKMKKHGYAHFVGLDGCVAMLDVAKNTGLYQDVKQCMLGAEELPVQWGSQDIHHGEVDLPKCDFHGKLTGTFDIVLIVGGLSVGHVPIACVRQLCNVTKPGGLICMTTRTVRNNLVYKASLEQELKQMEEERLWTCVNVTEVEEFQLAVAEHEENEFIGGCVYLYRVSPL